MRTEVRFLMLFLLAAAALGACSGKAATGSAAPGTDREVGRFVWQDLVTSDVSASRKFYAELLGWEFREQSRFGKPYLLALSGDVFVGGIVASPAQQAGRSAWLSYLAVDDIDRALRQVRDGGGKVLVDPVSVDGFGRAAVIADPQGAPLGLASVEVAIPREPASPEIGRFFWREYLARSASSALSFYASLAGYQSEVTESAAGLDYHVLRRGRTRGGLFQIPSTEPDIEPNWLPYIRVEDPGALASRVEALGGRVLLAPSAPVRKGTLAVIADPTGAAVALQKWPL